eukprot:CAMPEP_0118831632 /NCGR_PEP_ID=MMETSP1162-20130426/31063_1 /TAXON_ID=33656 /ORGANISM="Phaeocystis Sp, Strain CCMP2710" /LENGTH=306 /DNA_ID=CAMNT_0006763069 /DNA_START=365 /DNA_END=1282 /DNA_ORIENTATION=-
MGCVARRGGCSDRLLGTLVEANAARPVQGEEHHAAHHRERLEEVVLVKVDQPCVHVPEGVHPAVGDKQHDGEYQGRPLGLEPGAHQGGESEEQQGAGDPKEGRLGEGLMQAPVLVVDGLEEEDKGEEEPPAQLQPVRALALLVLQQAHIAASALLVVFAPDKQQQAARQRHRSAHKVHVLGLAIHERLDRYEDEQPVTAGLDAARLYRGWPDNQSARAQLRGGGEKQAEDADVPVHLHDLRHVVDLLAPAQEDAQAVLDEGDDEQEGAHRRQEVLAVLLRHRPLEEALHAFDQLRLELRHLGRNSD